MMGLLPGAAARLRRDFQIAHGRTRYGWGWGPTDLFLLRRWPAGAETRIHEISPTHQKGDPALRSIGPDTARCRTLSDRPWTA